MGERFVVGIAPQSNPFSGQQHQRAGGEQDVRAQGLRVLALSQVFVGRSEVGDDEWLERVGLREWIAFTDDRKVIRQNAHFLANSDVRLFVIKFKYGNGKQLAHQLRGRLELIDSCCRGRAPFVYELYPNNIARVDLRKVF